MHLLQSVSPRPQNRTSMLLGAVTIALGTMAPLVASAQQADALMIGETGNVGLGLAAPERQLHIRGSNAQVRIDRQFDATSFQLVRTAPDTVTVWKSFVFGVLSQGPDNGSFFIRDNAQLTSGSTDRLRMVINNSGDTTFQGVVSAPGFNNTSAARYKSDIETLTNAGEHLERLRGVRFKWKESGQPSIGFIAEEVAGVFPELVGWNEQTGETESVNYAALTAVLLEAYKAQQSQIRTQQAELLAYRDLFASQQALVQVLQNRLERVELRQTRLAETLEAPPSITAAWSQDPQ